MIEIERQFRVEPGARENLLKHAEFQGKKLLKDVYYDTPDFVYARQDLWLRKRNDMFELKAPTQAGHELAEQYLEITDEALILRYLHLELQGDFESTIAMRNILPYCMCTTHREEYVLEGVTLDFDETIFTDGFTYALGEAELLIDDKAEAGNTAQKLDEFMRRHGLQDAHVEDKLVAYLRAHRAKDFDMLQEAGVL